MSGAFLIATDKSSAEPKREFFGLQISRACKPLDRLAKQLGVEPLTSFISLDEGDQEMAAEIAEEAGVDISDWKPEPVQWFEPSEGLATVGALLEHLREQPRAIRRGPGVVKELTELHAVLTAMARRKARWRFWIDT